MRRTLLLLAALLVVAGCADAREPTVANPASVHCEEEGGTLDLRADEDGSEVGICVFDDGSVCEEWALYRGECEPGGSSRD